MSKKLKVLTRGEILRQCKNRMIKGNKKHGAWNPLIDDRDLINESIEENEDSINYHIMQIQKLDLMKQKLERLNCG